MAQLDRLLAVMAGNRAGVLTLDEGNPAQYLTARGADVRAVTRTPLTGAQIASLLREIVPPESVDALDRGDDLAFMYECAEGRFSTQATLLDGRWRVRIGAAEPDPAIAPRTAEHLVADIDPEQFAGVVSSARARIDQLLRLTVERGASDLHLRSGETPILRCDGAIVRMNELARLRADDVSALLDAIMPHENRAELAETNDTDFAYELPGCGRFRANAFRDRLGAAAVFRRIPPSVVTVEQLGLPPEVQRLCALTRGLVLVTGPTGSGKSTTLCALIDLINRTRADHIITIEDPIEFVHASRRCIVSQREVGAHTRSFKTALRAALREDPDVVLIGEMRDLETVSIALETAETGHLVLATLHTATAATTIDRIIDQFPADQQEQIRVMLADSLRGVISQTLCRKIGGGRAAAREVLFNTAPVANLIRERKTFQIGAIMQTSKRLGMATMNDALIDLVDSRQIDVDEAHLHAPDKPALIGALRAKGHDVSAFDLPEMQQRAGSRPRAAV
jgi:twitching motility protein PilT